MTVEEFRYEARLRAQARSPYPTQELINACLIDLLVARVVALEAALKKSGILDSNGGGNG